MASKKQPLGRKKHAWKEGVQNAGVPAMVANSVFAEIMKEQGCIDAEAVVKKATPKDAAMHPCFEWDTKKAAHKHRLHQAKRLIGGIVVTFIDDPRKEKPPIRAYVKFGDSKGTYAPIEIALATQSGRESLLAQAVQQLRSLQVQYGHLQELAKVFAELDQL